MLSTPGFKELSEVEASIVLCVATVVADGEVNTGETEEFVNQVKLITGKSVNSRVDFEQDVSVLLTHLEPSISTHPLKLSPEQVRFLAGLILNDDLKITVMNAIFEIAFSDDVFHNSEREIVEILREIWGV